MSQRMRLSAVCLLLFVPVLAGCLGQRHESHVPEAELGIWDSKLATPAGPGFPRLIKPAVGQGTYPGRGTIGGTLPRGTLPRGTLPRGTLPRGTLPQAEAPRQN